MRIGKFVVDILGNTYIMVSGRTYTPEYIEKRIWPRKGRKRGSFMNTTMNTTMATAIEKRILEEYGDVVSVEETEVTKNNDVARRAFVVKVAGSNISPTIYYQPKFSEEENIEMVVKVWGEDVAPRNLDMTDFLDWDKVKDHIVPRIVNHDRNNLEDIPHKDFLDLAIEYVYLFEGGDLDQASILIHNSHLEYWGRTVESLDIVAWKNRERMGFTCRSIMDYLRAITGMSPEEIVAEEGFFPMYVVSNNSGLFGATVIADDIAMHRAYEKLGKKPLLVFPSSIHEVIVIPDDGNAMMYAPMVQEINSTELQEQDILSDSVYRYDGEKVTKIA